MGARGAGGACGCVFYLKHVDDLNVLWRAGAAAVASVEPTVASTIPGEVLASLGLLTDRLKGRALVLPLLRKAGDGVAGPHAAGRCRADGGARRVELELGGFVPAPPQNRRPDEVQRHLLERLLRQWSARRRQAVGVSTAVLRKDPPADLDVRASLPRGLRRHRRECAAGLALECLACVLQRAKRQIRSRESMQASLGWQQPLVSCLVSAHPNLEDRERGPRAHPWQAAASGSARVNHGRRARRAPRALRI